MLKQFVCAITSWGSVERVFSFFVLVYSDLRNGPLDEKVGELVFLSKYYDDNKN